MHYEIDSDKSHLEEIGGGLCRTGFGRGYVKEKDSQKGALQHQVVTRCLRGEFHVLRELCVSCVLREASVGVQSVI